MNFFDSSVSFVEAQWQQRLVQVCVFSALLFFILGSYDLIDYVQKMLAKVGLKFGKDSTRAVHAVIFGCLLYVLSRFVMDPLVKRLSNGVEGMEEGEGDKEDGEEEVVDEVVDEDEGFGNIVEGQTNQNLDSFYDERDKWQDKIEDKLLKMQKRADGGDQEAKNFMKSYIALMNTLHHRDGSQPAMG